LAAIVRFGVVLAKVCCLIFVFIWIRWTVPRFRFDQLMSLTWRGLVPIGMALTAGVGGLVYFDKAITWYAPVVDVVVVAGALLLSPVLSGSVTGRQVDLPDIEVVPAESKSV